MRPGAGTTDERPRAMSRGAISQDRRDRRRRDRVVDLVLAEERELCLDAARGVSTAMSGRPPGPGRRDARTTSAPAAP